MLNQANAFHRFHSAADVVFIAGGARKHQRIENDVFGSEAVLFREQPVGTLRNGQLALARERLSLDGIFINATDHNGSAKLVGNRHGTFEFFLAILEVNGIDDGFALAVGQRQFDGRGIGGIDHHRRFHFSDQLFVEQRDIFLLIALRALQAHVHDLRAATHLAPGNLAGLLPFLFRDEVLEESRADDVGSFADEQRPRGFFHLNRLDSRIDRPVGLCRPLPGPFAFRHLRNRANVLLGRGAAPADKVDPAVGHKFLELGGQRCRRLPVLIRFGVRQASIGIAGDEFASELAQGSNMISHEFWPGGAIHSERQRLGIPQRSPHGLDRLSGQHRAHRLDGHGNNQRHLYINLFRKPPNGEQRRLDVPRVLTGFDQQQIRASLNQALRLHVVGVAQFRKRDAACHGDRFRGRSHRACYKPRPSGRAELVRCLPGQFRGALVEEMRVRGQSVLGQHDGGAAETVGLDDVRTSLEIFPVNIQDHVGTSANKILVAAFERGAAKIGSAEIALLEHGAHRAVKHENSLREQLPQGLGRFVQVTHPAKSSAPCRVPSCLGMNRRENPGFADVTILREFANEQKPGSREVVVF